MAIYAVAYDRPIEWSMVYEYYGVAEHWVVIKENQLNRI